MAVLKNVSYPVEVAYEWSHSMRALLELALGVTTQGLPKVGGTSYLRSLSQRKKPSSCACV